MEQPKVSISDEADLLGGQETWVNILEPELCKDVAAVEVLARLLFIIREEISRGPEGVLKASQVLLNGIEVIYLYTNAHKAALKLYLLSLRGELQSQDEPVNLINAAIKRGESATRAKKGVKGNRGRLSKSATERSQ